MKIASLLLFVLCTVADAHIPDGPKTLSMVRRLDAGLLLSYERMTHTFKHQGLDFDILRSSTEDFSNRPLVSIGSNPRSREILSLNPHSSPILEAKYRALAALVEKTSFPASLELISHFVREKVFDPRVSTESHSNAFIRDWVASEERREEEFTRTKEGTLIPVIPLEAFMSAKVGVCRHQALAAAYFLDRLSQECLLPQGRTLYVRDIVRFRSLEGGHAWTLYREEGSQDAWHIDSLWNVIKNLNDPDDLEFLYSAYGKRAIDREQNLQAQ